MNNAVIATRDGDSYREMHSASVETRVPGRWIRPQSRLSVNRRRRPWPTALRLSPLCEEFLCSHTVSKPPHVWDFEATVAKFFAGNLANLNLGDQDAMVSPLASIKKAHKSFAI